jgi:hypothetical protein
MRARFGGYFLGQVGTFVYLIGAMKDSPQFDHRFWPGFSLYNLVVANFWPFYWLGYFIDRMKLDQIYWQVYEVTQPWAAAAIAFFNLPG